MLKIVVIGGQCSKDYSLIRDFRQQIRCPAFHPGFERTRIRSQKSEASSQNSVGRRQLADGSWQTAERRASILTSDLTLTSDF